MEETKIKIRNKILLHTIVVLVICIIYTTIFVSDTYARYLKTYDYVDKISFVGDIYPREGITAKAYDEGGIDRVVHTSYQKIINESDLLVGNLECAITDNKDAVASKSFTFRIEPKHTKILSDAKIDVVTLANNHSMDYGKDALIDTINNLNKYNISYFGVGDNTLDAIKPLEKYINGRRYLFFAGSGVVPDHNWFATNDTFGMSNGYHAEEICNSIKKEKKKDPNCICIAYMHWGEEKNLNITERQESVGKKLVDAGADLVIGSHPHIFQKIEYYNNVPIIYSMGNFIYGETETNTLILTAYFDYNENDNKILYIKIDPGFSGREMVKLDAYKNEREENVYNLLVNSPTCEIYDGVYIREKLAK